MTTAREEKGETMPNYTERATYHAPSIRERDAGYDAERVGDELAEIAKKKERELS